MWRKLLIKVKLAFFNAVKSKEKSSIYKDFKGRDENFIPKIFKEKSHHKMQSKRQKMKTSKPYKIKSSSRTT